MNYVLRLKTNNSRVFATNADSLEAATEFFRQGKQMDEQTFNQLYIVTEYTSRELDEIATDQLDDPAYRRRLAERQKNKSLYGWSRRDK